MKPTILILNAPPFAGKDTIANVLADEYGFIRHEFKKPLLDIAIAITQLEEEEFFDIYNDRNFKEQQSAKFLNLSPRDLMILISEKMCKPNFGKDYFGKLAVNSLKRSIELTGGNLHVFSDGGFLEEVLPLAETFGKDSVKVVRFYRENDRKDFGSDSRTFIDAIEHGVFTSDILHNDRTPYLFCEKIISLIA